MKLLKLMFGFIFAMLGLIIAVYSTHHVVGLLLFILQKWNKDNQEYEIVQNITTERFELNKRNI